jgi:CBS domain-containing protein
MIRTVADIMNRKLLYLAEGSRAELAREPILKFGVTAVPVLDESGRPVGVVSLRDLLADEPPRRPVSPAVSVPSTSTIESAARVLAESDYHHLVVVDATSGRAVGMVSSVDLLRAMLDLPARHPAAFPAFSGGEPQPSP